jgi:hypothetical protein
MRRCVGSQSKSEQRSGAFPDATSLKIRYGFINVVGVLIKPVKLGFD